LRIALIALGEDGVLEKSMGVRGRFSMADVFVGVNSVQKLEHFQI